MDIDNLTNILNYMSLNDEYHTLTPTEINKLDNEIKFSILFPIFIPCRFIPFRQFYFSF